MYDAVGEKTRFGLIISGHDLRKSIELGILAEKSQFDSVWVPDHLVGIQYSEGLRGSLVDPWVTLAAIGVQTHNIFLCSAVTDGLRTHPAKLAHIVSTLDELTGGRAGLGIGAGEAMNILPFGMNWEKPRIRADRLREAIEVIKLLWRSSRARPVEYDGKYYQLKDAFLDQSYAKVTPPPIYVGAVGSPRTLEITGELGDGWFPYVNTPDLYSRRITRIKKGAERAGRRIEQIDTVVWLDTLLSDDSTQLERAVNKMKLLLAIERNTIKSLGHDVTIPVGYSVQNVYGLGTGRICSESDVTEAANEIPDNVVHQFSAIGSEDNCIEKIQNFIEAGARHIAIRDLGPNVASTLETFNRKIMPHFKGTT